VATVLAARLRIAVAVPPIASDRGSNGAIVHRLLAAAAELGQVAHHAQQLVGVDRLAQVVVGVRMLRISEWPSSPGRPMSLALMSVVALLTAAGHTQLRSCA